MENTASATESTDIPAPPPRARTGPTFGILGAISFSHFLNDTIQSLILAIYPLFKTEFGLPIEKKGDEKSAARLRRLVFPFILRRTKDQVAPELPPRTERILYCDMTPAQRKLYVKTRLYG